MTYCNFDVAFLFYLSTQIPTNIHDYGVFLGSNRGIGYEPYTFPRENSGKTVEPRVHRGGTDPLLRQGVPNIGGKVVAELKPPSCKNRTLLEGFKKQTSAQKDADTPRLLSPRLLLKTL